MVGDDTGQNIRPVHRVFRRDVLDQRSVPAPPRRRIPSLPHAVKGKPVRIAVLVRGALLSDDTPKRVKVCGFGGVEGTPALHIQHGVVKLLNFTDQHGDELPQHARCQKLARQLGKRLVDQGLGILPKRDFKAGRNRHGYCPRTVTVMSPTSKVAT